MGVAFVPGLSVTIARPQAARGDEAMTTVTNMSFVKYALMTSAILLIGCQTSGNEGSSQRTQVAATQTPATATVQNATVAVAGFRCPSPGTTVTYSDGRTVRYEGADQNDPSVCLLTRSDGQQIRLLFNFYNLPTADEASIRRGFSALWPLETGKTASFTYITHSRDVTRTFRYRDTWRVERAERVMLAGEQRQVLVLTRMQEGMFNNNFSGTETYQYDPQTGVFLSRTVQVQRGISSARPFEVARLQLQR